MPDPDKLRVLRDEAGYLVAQTCGQCKHGRFAPGSNFGSCTQFVYTHAKHGERALSVHVAGRCSNDLFEWNAKKLADLQRSGFEEFRTTQAGRW